MEQLEKDIEALENEKAEINEALNSGALSNTELHEKSVRYTLVTELLEEKEMRWLELSEI